jgi:hypothetical protein
MRREVQVCEPVQQVHDYVSEGFRGIFFGFEKSELW